MKIRYLGHSSFLLIGSDKSVVTDPFSGIGYDMERVTCDYCTVSHGHFDHSAVNFVNARKIITDSEDGFAAIESYHDPKGGLERGKNKIFVFSVDGIKFCHMGDVGEYFSERLADEIGSPDVLFIPVGGNYTIDYREAIKYADAIKAKITVPMHYKTAKSNLDIDGVQPFLKHEKCVERVGEEIELTKETLPTEESVYVFDDKNF